MTDSLRAFLPYGRHVIEDDDIAAVTQVLRGDWLTTGPAVEQFEAALAQHVDASHVVAVSSGSAALHLAMMMLDAKPGDAVIVPAMTFVATASTAVLAGFDVVFADVDPISGLLTADTLVEAYGRAQGRHVRAVVPVHLNGQSCDLASVSSEASARGAVVVDDAAHAFGTLYNDRPVGSDTLTCMTAFSFHPVKAIAVGEGGAIATADASLAQRMRRLRNHGISRDTAEFVDTIRARDRAGILNPWYYEVDEPGLNYRLNEISCALGMTQLAKLDRFISRRAELVASYDRLLSRLGPVVAPIRRVPHCVPAWHLYPVQVDFAARGISRAAVMNQLRARQIGTQVHYIPVHLHPYFRRKSPALSLPGAERYGASVLSLPLHAAMTDRDPPAVVSALLEALASPDA